MSLWYELAIAFCLFLVLEGVVPFLYPQRWRTLVARLAMVNDRTLRLSGLLSMLVGVGLLYLLR